MSVPGVNVQTAATFMAAVGDVHRFSTPRKLVSYLGLDPRVRQSGNAPDRHGRLSTAAASKARHMLGQAAWKVTLTPGPMRAFFQRVRARRGPQIAATAASRKLVVLFRHSCEAEAAYLDRSATGPAKGGAGVTRGRASQEALEGQSSAAGYKPRNLLFARSVTRTEEKHPTNRPPPPLDFHPSVITRSTVIP
jgi:hypothetical protein